MGAARRRRRGRARAGRAQLPRRHQDRPAHPGARRRHPDRAGGRGGGIAAGGDAGAANLGGWASLRAGGAYGVLQAAGLLFFAFAGYARIATMGEEVRDPRRTIVRAIPIALFLTVAIYLVVGTAALLAAGPDRLAGSAAPLATAVEAAGAPALAPVVRAAGRWRRSARCWP
ncbi:amino acid permease [Actinomadura madurae]|uniref:amino acid permease n=1 Tax=Actinomadura madurae TaxID=1993 RepID=UPI0027E2809D|nr:amino acid permease [Actinomadura madurae]